LFIITYGYGVPAAHVDWLGTKALRALCPQPFHNRLDKPLAYPQALGQLVSSSPPAHISTGATASTE